MTVDEELVSEEGLSVDYGVYVSSVDEGGPLDDAGVEVGDVIVALNGTEITSVEQLEEMLSELEAGDEIELSINRNGEDLVLKVTLEEDSSETLTSSLSLTDSNDSTGSTDEQSASGGFTGWLMDNLLLVILCVLGILAAITAAIWWFLRRRRDAEQSDDNSDFFKEDADGSSGFALA